jgi:hypothetical protein
MRSRVQRCKFPGVCRGQNTQVPGSRCGCRGGVVEGETQSQRSGQGRARAPRDPGGHQSQRVECLQTQKNNIGRVYIGEWKSVTVCPTIALLERFRLVGYVVCWGLFGVGSCRPSGACLVALACERSHGHMLSWPPTAFPSVQSATIIILRQGPLSVKCGGPGRAGLPASRAPFSANHRPGIHAKQGKRLEGRLLPLGKHARRLVVAMLVIKDRRYLASACSFANQASYQTLPASEDHGL